MDVCRIYKWLIALNIYVGIITNHLRRFRYSVSTCQRIGAGYQRRKSSSSHDVRYAIVLSCNINMIFAYGTCRQLSHP